MPHGSVSRRCAVCCSTLNGRAFTDRVDAGGVGDDVEAVDGGVDGRAVVVHLHVKAVGRAGRDEGGVGGHPDHDLRHDGVVVHRGVSQHRASTCTKGRPRLVSDQY